MKIDLVDLISVLMLYTFGCSMLLQGANFVHSPGDALLMAAGFVFFCFLLMFSLLSAGDH
jgi:hypothetical protein